MHRMIAGERQAGNNDLRIFRRRDAIGRQWIANNLVVLLGVEAAFVDADTGASGGALRLTRAETLDLVGVPIAF